MNVETKSDLLALIAGHRRQLRDFGIQRIGIFGSFVRHMLDETQYLVSHTRELDKVVLLGDETLRRAFDWEAIPHSPGGRACPARPSAGAPVMLLICS